MDWNEMNQQSIHGNLSHITLLLIGHKFNNLLNRNISSFNLTQEHYMLCLCVGHYNS